MRPFVASLLMLLAGIALTVEGGVTASSSRPSNLPASTLSLWYPSPGSDDCVFDQGSIYQFTAGTCDTTVLTTTYGKLWFVQQNVTTVLLFVTSDSTSLQVYGFANETACANFDGSSGFLQAFAYPTNLVSSGQECRDTSGIVVQPPTQQGPAAPIWPPVGYYAADQVDSELCNNPSFGMLSTLVPLESCVETLGKRFLRNYCTLDPVSGLWNLTTVFYPLPGCNTMPMFLQIQQQGVCYGDDAFRCPEQGVSSLPPTIGGPLVVTTDYGVMSESCAATPALTIVQPRDKCILPSYGNTWIAHECDSQKQQLTIWFFDEHGCGSGPPTSNLTYPIGNCAAQGGDSGSQLLTEKARGPGFERAAL